ncbi:SMI1/KNR4 family protein [Alkalihalophilus marmarensis]|uniref:Knr4/Smi1-like domain-containing protein n=1 Tax=Alkalihalophilus marmarensis DSM 21297 TaxID=1188261 RepID=U6SK63_9BACI|nr:SMI1/KNR4 family protein [Alkalihalophilus marmarensis]ERN51963.1 hypothetical protein A33I_18400 [Alkalihalophilus marmarensis DSM 21297]
MEKIKKLLTQIKNLTGCRVREPNGLPIIDETSHVLPEDVRDFYSLCGGVVLFEHEDYPTFVVPPDKFVLANPIIIGELCEEDISSNWYIICNDGKDDYLTIDLAKERLGRCYDSFFDRHGLVGETQVIATSFTDLFERLIENKGQYWYWLKNDFDSLGDAYNA